MSPTRRLFISAGAAATLAGCGFRLRGVPSFAFSTIHINGPDNSPLLNELRQQIGSSGSVQVIREAARVAEAQVVMDLISEQREKVVVGLNASCQVLEIQLRVRLKFKLRTPQGKELIPETELLQQRDISFSETAVLSKEAEEGLLYRTMQSEIVQQLMRRLAAVKGL